MSGKTPHICDGILLLYQRIAERNVGVFEHCLNTTFGQVLRQCFNTTFGLLFTQNLCRIEVLLFER